MSRRSNCEKLATELAIISPAGVVVSTPRSIATSAHPFFHDLSMSRVKSVMERDSRSSLATTSASASPFSTASRALASAGRRAVVLALAPASS